MHNHTAKKHTTLNLDLGLVRDAREILKTEGTTETIHAALLDVVNRHKRFHLLEYDFPGLAPESLEISRGHRVFEPDEDVPPA